MIYNVNRPKGKRALKPKDFMASEKKRQSISSPKELAEVLKRLTLSHGGKIK